MIAIEWGDVVGGVRELRGINGEGCGGLSESGGCNWRGDVSLTEW